MPMAQCEQGCSASIAGWIGRDCGNDAPSHRRKQQGAIAQLGERLPCTQEVAGSTPVGSTSAPRM